MSFPLDKLPDYVIMEYLERLPDMEFVQMCVLPVSKKIQKLCKANGDMRARMEKIKTREIVTRENDILKETEYRDKDGHLSNYFGPAIIREYKNEDYVEKEWFINGERKNIDPDGPIVHKKMTNADQFEYSDGTIKHFEDGSLIKEEKYLGSKNGVRYSKIITYGDDGSVESYSHDDLTAADYYSIRPRLDEGPLLVEYDEDGNVVLEINTIEGLKQYNGD